MCFFKLGAVRVVREMCCFFSTRAVSTVHNRTRTRTGCETVEVLLYSSVEFC